MSKIQQTDWTHQQAGKAIDLDEAKNNAEARSALKQGGLTMDELRGADRSRDGVISSGEAWKLADSFDDDGNPASLIDGDGAGNKTPAGQAIRALGLLMKKRETRGEARRSEVDTAPEGLPASAHLKELSELMPQLGSQFRDGRLQIDESVLRQAESRFGPPARARLEAWRDLNEEIKGRDVSYKINRVNTFFNDTIRYTNDERNVGVRDYWQSPIESLASGKGDCEDYAVAKYVALRQLGIPAKNMDITVARHATEGLHAVLAVRDASGTTKVLDNRSTLALPAERLPMLIPIFGFNEERARILDRSTWAPNGLRMNLQRFPKANGALRRSRAVLP